MEYARLVVVKMIEFPEKSQRAELLKQLDASLFDENVRAALGERLKEGLWTMLPDDSVRPRAPDGYGRLAW